MKKSFRIFLYSVAGLVVFILVAVFAANIILKDKIKKAIVEDLPEHFELTYSNLDIRTLAGSLIISDPHLAIKNKEGLDTHTLIQADRLEINDFSYWNYLFKKEISLDHILLEKLKLVYHKDRKAKTTKSDSDQNPNLKRTIKINKIQLYQADFQVFDGEEDSLFFATKRVKLNIYRFEMSQNTLKNKLPFQYEDVALSGDSVFLKAGEYENLEVAHFQVDKKTSEFDEISLYTKFSEEELNRIIPYERDHYDLKVESVLVDQYDYRFANDSLQAGSKKLVINSVNFDVFRNKTTTKDTTFKPLYNRSLRQLPFALSVDSILINHADIRYTERHQAENRGGIITFRDLNATIANVGNTYSDPIDAEINAKFMEDTPFTANWKLFVQSPSDHFVFRAEVDRLDASRMNAFIEPNLFAKLDGEATHTFFTIDGNNENSKTNVKIKYSGLKVSVLRKDHSKKGFLSAVVNMVIPKDSNGNGTEFNDGTGTADRHKTQSVFNQLWISLESSLKDAMLPGIVKKLAE